MKDEYDFSNAEQGRFYVPADEIELPIYLDADVREHLRRHAAGKDIQTLVNDLLRKDIEIAGRLSD
jgi:uncharacterized protein (DUF4415 family)